MENTKIEWADHTFNPWEGCAKISPGCDNCYAESRNARFAGGTSTNWGAGAPRRRTSASNWRKPVEWNAKAKEFLAQHGRRQRVFCASLADVFDNEVDPSWRADLFQLIKATPDLIWLLLTKRIGNARPMIADALTHESELSSELDPLPNVWIGATIVNQVEADRDIPKLLAVPAAKRFLSIEPMLGEIDLDAWLSPEHERQHIGAQAGIHWVIVGGESGANARPMHPEWAESLRDQCAAAQVPFLFKQWGEWAPGETVQATSGFMKTALWFDNRWLINTEDLACEGHADDEPDLYRVGKKVAGRFLDGLEHNGVPT
jgi:protein gp37